MTIFYDSDCGLCARSIKVLQHLDVDQRFIYLSLASPEAERYSIETGTVALVNGEKLHLRSEAVRLMLWHAGGVALILSLFLWMIPLPIRDWAYRLIAKHRYRFFGGVCDLSGL